MEYAISAVIGYLAGGFNPAYLFAKAKGFDIRKKGSGNAGASNAVLTMGKKVGVASAVLDILKTVLVYLLAEHFFVQKTLAGLIAGVSCQLGHIFPLFMHFRGGKGLACLGGILIAYDWRVFLGLLVVEAVIVLLSDYICFVSITGPFLFAGVYAVLEKDLIGTLILLVPAVVMFFKHIPNLKRIRDGKEVRFSYLWKGKKELDRVKEET